MNDVALIAITVLLFVVIAALVMLLRQNRQPSAQVLCIAGPALGQGAPFRNGRIRIGSAADNDIVLNERLVSPHHAEITKRGDVPTIEDLDSVNGTWVNGQRVAQISLRPDMRFVIGASTFVVSLDGVAQAATGPSARADLNASPNASAEAPSQSPNVPNYNLTLIAEGGQVEVYKGVSRADGSTVVVKQLKNVPFDAEGRFSRQKFEQQLVIGTTIRHPYCVRILGGSSTASQPYLIEEYVPGGTLQDRLRVARRMSPTEAMRIIGQTCDAIAYLHRRGIVHRDLSPNNIMFGDDGNVRVIDFGLARVAGVATITTAGMLMGKPKYMSVEQAMGARAVPQSDLYALGVIAYEMLAGRPPFEGKALDILEQHIHTPPPALRQIAPDVPEAMANAVMRTLEKDPQRRFANAEEMARSFGYVLPFHSGESSITSAKRVKAGLLAKNAQLGLQLRDVKTARVLAVAGESTPVALTRAQINPADRAISRQHGQLALRDNLWWIEEIPGAPSANGIYVNDARLTEPLVLSRGDEIRLGDTRLIVE